MAGSPYMISDIQTESEYCQKQAGAEQGHTRRIKKVPEKLVSRIKFGLKKIWVQKNLSPEKIWPTKMGIQIGYPN